MKVYIVRGTVQHECCDILDVFADKDDASAFIEYRLWRDQEDKKYENYAAHIRYDNYHVEEHEVV